MRNRFVLKAAVTALFICLAYAVVIEVRQPIMLSEPNQWQGNRITAEHYLYGQQPLSVVFVGSSLTDRLGDAPLGKTSHNLSFAAGGALTGLEIVDRSERLPKTVVVETNYIDMPVDRAFIDSLFSPAIYHLKKRVRALRSEYQPIELLVDRIRPVLKKLEKRYLVDKPKGEDMHAPKLFSFVLDEKRREYRVLPNEKVLKIAIDRTKKLIESLAHKGVNIVFLEMPVYEGLSSLPYPTQIFRQMSAAFPKQDYGWLVYRNDGRFHTTDSEHLDAQSARNLLGLIRNDLAGLAGIGTRGQNR